MLAFAKETKHFFGMRLLLAFSRILYYLEINLILRFHVSLCL
jgi:hypothetical protein